MEIAQKVAEEKNKSKLLLLQVTQAFREDAGTNETDNQLHGSINREEVVARSSNARSENVDMEASMQVVHFQGFVAGIESQARCESVKSEEVT